MLKSNFDLVGKKFVGCIAVQNFRKFRLSLSRSKRRTNFHSHGYILIAVCDSKCQLHFVGVGISSKPKNSFLR